MNYRAEIFCQQFPIVKRFVFHLVYYRELHTVYTSIQLKSSFWTHTIDAHLLQSAIYWCMVFGSEGCNPTHWKHLSEDDVGQLRDNFRQLLFRRTNFTASTWENYWQEMVDFRSKYAAHRELNYTTPIPRFDSALEVAHVYDEWIRDVISPDVFEEPYLKTSEAELRRSIRPLITELLNKTKEYNNT